MSELGHIILPSWPDGVSAPAFNIEHPDKSIYAVMPDPLNEFAPRFFGAATEKRSKYTGDIHRVYLGELFECEYEWILYRDVNAFGLSGEPFDPPLNYLDVIHLLHAADMVADRSSASITLYPHGAMTGYLAEADFPGHYWGFNVRLSKPPEITPMKTVAKRVKLTLTANGFIDNLPYNMRVRPQSWIH